MNCKERNYELITDITAYPDGAVSFAKPMQVFEKHITDTEFTTDEEQAIAVPMKGGSGKLEVPCKPSLPESSNFPEPPFIGTAMAWSSSGENSVSVMCFSKTCMGFAKETAPSG